MSSSNPKEGGTGGGKGGGEDRGKGKEDRTTDEKPKENILDVQGGNEMNHARGYLGRLSYVAGEEVTGKSPPQIKHDKDDHS
ncbi:hypothetical protein TYRP_010432 [Tyrophagus putrescentiae]|nr:hypothetical protein TYRP_010432 [Tyrophagus putrescentiae]